MSPITIKSVNITVMSLWVISNFQILNLHLLKCKVYREQNLFTRVSKPFGFSVIFPVDCDYWKRTCKIDFDSD